MEHEGTECGGTKDKTVQSFTLVESVRSLGCNFKKGDSSDTSEAGRPLAEACLVRRTYASSLDQSESEPLYWKGCRRASQRRLIIYRGTCGIRNV